MPAVARVVAIVLLVAEVVLGALALKGDSTAAATPRMPITPVSEPVEPLTIDTALAITDPIALAWNEDAHLISALMEVLWPQDGPVVVPSEVPIGGALTLVYAAGEAQLTLLMDRGSGDVFHAETGEWSSELAVPLSTDQLQRSSAIAVLAAEVSYGTTYRAACPDYRFVTRVFLANGQGEDGHPAWLVSYADERHRDQPDIRVRVDTVTGKTVGGQASGLGCADE